MPRSYDVTPTQITHHPTQRIDPVPGRLPDIKPEDLINGFAKAMKMLTGVDITSTTAFFQWLKEATGLDFVILGQIIDSIVELLGIDPDNPVDIEAQWAKIKDEYLDPISDFLTPDSPLNGANLFGLLDIPFVMLRNSNQELLENPTFFGDLAVGNRRRWSHVTDVYRNDADPPGAETVVCNGELTAIRSNRGQVAEGQMIVGEVHVLGNQVAGAAGADLVRLELVSYLNNVRVGTPVSVGLKAFTLDPAGAGWVNAPNTALAGRLELDWTVPAGVDEVELRTEVTASAASGRAWVDSGSLQRGFNWNRVERDFQGMLGILDGIADPDHWEAAYLGLKDLLSLVGIDTSGWVLPEAFGFWRDFNTNTSAIVNVFAHLGSRFAWEDAWDGVRGLATQFGVDTSDWPDDLTPGGLIVSFVGLVSAGNALFQDLGNKAKWAAGWAALQAFTDDLLGPGVIVWPQLTPGGWFVDVLNFVQGLIGGGDGGNGPFPKPAGGVSADVVTGLKYSTSIDLGGVLPEGNLFYSVTAVVGGVETPASSEVLCWLAGIDVVWTKVRLDWKAFPGATEYRVYRRIRSFWGDRTIRRIATVTGTSFTDQLPRDAGVAVSPPAGTAGSALSGFDRAAAGIGAAQATADGIASGLSQVGDIFGGGQPTDPINDPFVQSISDWWTNLWKPMATLSHAKIAGTGSASDLLILTANAFGTRSAAGVINSSYLKSMNFIPDDSGEVVQDAASGGLKFIRPGTYSFIVSLQVKATTTQYSLTPFVYKVSGSQAMLAGASYSNPAYASGIHPVVQVSGLIKIAAANEVYVPGMAIFANATTFDTYLRGDAPASAFFMSAVRVK